MCYHYVTHTYSIYLNSARTLIIMMQLLRFWLIENIWVFYFNSIRKVLTILSVMISFLWQSRIVV